MNKKPTVLDILRWHPNGVAEQRSVDDEYRMVSDKYAAIVSKLESLNGRVRELFATLRQVDDASDGR